MAVTTERKRRLSVYLDPDLKRRLGDFADQREQPVSLIAEAAIASFLSPDADERKEAATAKRLDRLDRSLQRMQRDLEITSETLALFVRVWLNSTSQLSEQVQSSMRAKGAERYSQFVEALGRRLASPVRLRREISEDNPKE